MSIIVQKFGGSSVANKDCLFNVANIIKKSFDKNNKLVVVVSAQGDTTDELLKISKEINPNPNAREMDVLLAVGEQISISLLSMTLDKIGIPSISLTGWQAGIQTCNCYGNARILNVFSNRIIKELDKGKVVVVAGFQGINEREDIVTMGRGGSDTTAVALAASLNADECQIYTDVNGIYTSDPRIILDAKKIKEISYDNMINLANMGAQVLNKRSVELAKKYNVELSVISSIKGQNHTEGTIVKEVDFKDNPISSVTIDEKIFLMKIESEYLFEYLKEIEKNQIPVLENFVLNNKSILIIKIDYIEQIKKIFENKRNFEIYENFAQISIIGSNREKNFENFVKICNKLNDSEIKYASVREIISILVDKSRGREILKIVHSGLILDK